MMNNFTFYSPTFFAFGDGEEKNTGALVRRFGGTKVLLVKRLSRREPT